MTTADPRDHLVLVLDVDDLDDALAYAERMSPWFGIVKVGYELYAAAGPEAFEALHHKGFRVFADLKLHDIPTTVERGARAIGRHGVEFLNFHAAGGETMLRAGLDGLRRGRARRGARATDRARGHGAHERHERRRARVADADRGERGLRRRGVCVVPTSRSRARTACAPWCPASDSRVVTRTIKRVSTRRAMRSLAAPTGSSSVAR